MIFQCSSCKEVFEKDGLQLVLHETTIARICPACLVGAEGFQITAKRDRPGGPYVFRLFQVADESGVYEVKNGRRSTKEDTDPGDAGT